MEITTRTREVIGTVSGILSTSAFAPQVYRLWSHTPQPAEDISFLTFLVITIAGFGWFTFGYSVKSKSMMISNGVTLALTLAVLVYKIIYG